MVSHFYLDTSALVKNYIAEAGSRWVQSVLRNTETAVLTSALTSIESMCTFARRRREGLLSEADLTQTCALLTHDFLHRYSVLVVDPLVLNKAQQLALRHPLRAYDAVHLATASLVQQRLTQAGESPLVFVCADERLLEVAQAEGLLFENPNRYP